MMRFLVLALAFCLWTPGLLAQDSPGDCAVDDQKFCKNIPRNHAGKKLGRDCLQAHVNELSAVCRAAITKNQQAQKNLAQACSSDAAKLCPSGGWIVKCLEANRSRLSSKCSAAVKTFRDVFPKRVPVPMSRPAPERAPDQDKDARAAELARLQQACAPEAGAKDRCRSGEDIGLCLMRRAAGLSPKCAARVKEFQRLFPAGKPQSAPAGAKPGPRPDQGAADRPAELKKLQLACIAEVGARDLCRSGEEIIPCLERNRGSLSEKCAAQLKDFQGKFP